MSTKRRFRQGYTRPIPTTRALCRSRGQTLARLDDRAQALAVHLAAKEISGKEWWIGLNDQALEGQHVWLDGLPGEPRRWSTDEPDDYRCGENCTALDPDKTGRWADMHCGYWRPFVCRGLALRNMPAQ